MLCNTGEGCCEYEPPGWPADLGSLKLLRLPLAASLES